MPNIITLMFVLMALLCGTVNGRGHAGHVHLGGGHYQGPRGGHYQYNGYGERRYS